MRLVPYGFLIAALSVGALGCENMPADIGEHMAGLSRCSGGTLGDLDYCDATCTGALGDGHCQNDGECDPGLVCGPFNGTQYGFPFNYQFCWPSHCRSGVVDGDETAQDCGGSCGACYCPLPDGHYAHCNSTKCPCPSGEGDCDTDAECQAGLICAIGTGPRFGYPTTTDMCLPPHCIDGSTNGDETGLDCGGSCGLCVCPGTSGDEDFCSPSCPCAAGEADCDADADCQGGLVCAHDVGSDWGFGPTVDVCLASHCTNSVQDGDEGGVDCGGSCGNSCPTAAVVLQSVDSSETQANGRTFLFLDVSSGGRYVAFISEATNLVAGDTNIVSDVFVRDNNLGTTQRVSESAFGVQANGRSIFASISDDGRYVAFASEASNLVPGDTNGLIDVFIKDRVLGSIWRMSESTAGAAGNADALFPRISGSGSIVTYVSGATNLVAGDNNGVDDVFVSNRITGETIRASRSTAGVEADAASTRAWLDGSGTYIVFSSVASNLVADDTNAASDVFLHHRVFRTTTRVSLADGGGDANSSSTNPRISSDASTIVFSSAASNLVPGDTNSRYDIFAVDRISGVAERVSVGDDESEADAHSIYGHPSGDGAYVAFSSGGANLVAGDTNLSGDVFVRDRAGGTTRRIEGPSGQGNSNSDFPVFDPTGAFLTFVANATTLVPTDTNGQRDVFLAPRP